MPTLIGGNKLDHVYLKGDMSIEIKNPQPFYIYHCANLVRIYYDKKKDSLKIYDRGLTREFFFLLSSSVFKICPFY